MLKFLRKHKFEAYTLAFLSMLLPALPLYRAAQAGHSTQIGLLLIPVILGNFLALMIK